MQCVRCDNEAQFIVNGDSVCREHKKDLNEEVGKSKGQLLSGM